MIVIKTLLGFNHSRGRSKQLGKVGLDQGSGQTYPRLLTPIGVYTCNL